MSEGVLNNHCCLKVKNVPGGRKAMPKFSAHRFQQGENRNFGLRRFFQVKIF